MLLAVDIGNTNIVFGLFGDESLMQVFRIETDRESSVEQYDKLISSSFKTTGFSYADITSVIVCSVVPQTRDAFREFCEKYLGKTPYDVSDNIQHLGIKIDIDNPKEVGADRVVNAMAFYHKYKRPGIIVDFGTATTFDVVNAEGDYLGGMISPGINLALKALHEAAAKLPEITIEKPARAIGRTTQQAMNSGIYYGYLGLIEHSVKEITSELHRNGLDNKPMVVATGGLAKFFETSDAIDAIEENLTLNGLLLINNKKDKR